MANKPKDPVEPPDDVVAGRAQELAAALLQLVAKPAPSLTARQKQAPDRATRDIQGAIEGARAATQAAILINGGAATAILAYLSKDGRTPPSILTAASYSLMAYALGVFFAALSVWCSTQAAANFGYQWEAIMDNDSYAEKFKEKGDRWLLGHHTTFALSILFFIGSSIWIARAFLVATQGT
jgi:hypothetical protein